MKKEQYLLILLQQLYKLCALQVTSIDITCRNVSWYHSVCCLPMHDDWPPIQSLHEEVFTSGSVQNANKSLVIYYFCAIFRISLNLTLLRYSWPKYLMAFLFWRTAVSTISSSFLMVEDAYSSAIPSFITATETIFFSPLRGLDTNCNAWPFWVTATKAMDVVLRRLSDANCNANPFWNTDAITTFISFCSSAHACWIARPFWDTAAWTHGRELRTKGGIRLRERPFCFSNRMTCLSLP